MKVIGLAGWSGAGKTTLLTRVIPHLPGTGACASPSSSTPIMSFDVDVPGKDSWVHRQSGADGGAGVVRQALGPDARIARRPRAAAAGTAGKMSRVDLVVVEGFKSEPHRKIEVHRRANNKPPLFPDDPAIAGIATDAAVETALPVAHLDDIEAVAAMMQKSAMPVEDVLAASAERGLRDRHGAIVRRLLCLRRTDDVGR